MTRPPSQEPQRPKGLFDPVKNLMRGKSSASRILEVSSPNPQPSCAPILPTVESPYPLRYDSVAWAYCDTSNRTTTQRMEAPLHGDNDINTIDSLISTQNNAEPPGEKRFSLMSLDVTPNADTEQQEPRSTHASLIGSEIAIMLFDPTSVSDEGYRFFLEEYVSPENL